MPDGAKVAKRLAPGLWMIGDELHVDLEEYVRALGGDPRSPEAQLAAVAAMREVCESEGIPFGVA